jgi:hypothetical protein
VVAAKGHDVVIVGGKNVIIWPDVDVVVSNAEGENGDYGSHSPSGFLNLNQHEDDDCRVNLPRVPRAVVTAQNSWI